MSGPKKENGEQRSENGEERRFTVLGPQSSLTPSPE